MRSIIDITDLTVAEIETLFDISHEMIAEKEKFRSSAQGKILATLFYEPSTRTRLSFESAMYSLGGQVLSMPAANNSSAAKGETIADTMKVVSNYADIIAIRHPHDGASLVAAQSANVPVINAGDGGHFHPTQTLADLLTIKRHFGKLQDLTVVCVGDLLYGRTVHSLLHALMCYSGNRFIMVSPDELRLPHEFMAEMRVAGVDFVQTSDLSQALTQADVVYMTRIQQERFADREEYERLKDCFILDAKIMQNAPDSCIVLHPLPRVGEIAVDFDEDPRAKYFAQTFNGKIMRAALIQFLLQDAAQNLVREQRGEFFESALCASANGDADKNLQGASSALLKCENIRCITHYERNIQLRTWKDGFTCVYCDGKCG